METLHSFTCIACAVTRRLCFRVKSQYVVCIANVGDSLAYVYSKFHGIREITAGSHDIEAERDIRDAGGAIGPVNGTNPELNNLTCSMTFVDVGDIVFLTTDGISDNYDPVVTKLAVAKLAPEAPESIAEEPSIDPSDADVSSARNAVESVNNGVATSCADDDAPSVVCVSQTTSVVKENDHSSSSAANGTSSSKSINEQDSGANILEVSCDEHIIDVTQHQTSANNNSSLQNTNSSQQNVVEDVINSNSGLHAPTPASADVPTSENNVAVATAEVNANTTLNGTADLATQFAPVGGKTGAQTLPAGVTSDVATSNAKATRPNSIRLRRSRRNKTVDCGKVFASVAAATSPLGSSSKCSSNTTQEHNDNRRLSRYGVIDQYSLASAGAEGQEDMSCRVRDGKPEMTPNERHRYAVREMEKVRGWG